MDVLATVPSSTSRAGEHPLIGVINRVASLRAQHEELLEKGPTPIDHLSASDTGYQCTRELQGDRIPLVDDTFTSGARAQSGASALSLAGGDVVAIVPIGRVITPNFNETVKEYWNRQRRTRFLFEECCLEEDADYDEEPWQ